MTKKTIFCTAATRTQAEDIVNRLKDEGFDSRDISALFPDRAETKEFVEKKHTKAPEGTVAGASTGGVIGGVLGWLAGIGTLAIPGVGPFIVAGPIMSALSGVAVGGAAGGIVGALIGFGIPEKEARYYEGKVREGCILISVHSDKDEKIETARTIFTQAGADDISSSTKTEAETIGSRR